MKEIFSLHYEIIIKLLLDIKKRKLNINKSLWLLLTTDSSQLEKVLEKYLKEFGLQNIASSKRIMILILGSSSYLLNSYNSFQAIDRELFTDIINDYNMMDAKDLINAFSNWNFAQRLIDDFLDYDAATYILKFQSKEIVRSEGNLKSLLKLNPFAIFDMFSSLEEKKFMDSELAIQTFFDIYSRSLNQVINNQEEDQDINNCELLHQAFIENLKKYFNEDENEICNFIHYLFGNVFEGLVVLKNEGNNTGKKYFKLISYLENTLITEMLDRFFSDSNFSVKIIDAFIICNEGLSEFELYERRETFKKNGNIIRLRRLNPHFMLEEYIYERLKKEAI